MSGMNTQESQPTNSESQSKPSSWPIKKQMHKSQYCLGKYIQLEYAKDKKSKLERITKL